MRILGIDTSSRFLCIGVYDSKIGVGEFRLDLEKKNSSFILVTVKRIIESLKIRLTDIDYFAVGLGPGSFTGIRIGLSVIKGLAYALKKPLIGISSLDILALNAGIEEKAICPVVDAKRNLIFSSLYIRKDAHLKRMMPYKLISCDELLKKVPRRTIFLGDALKLYKARIAAKVRGAALLDEDYWYPKAGSIIALAREMIAVKKIDNIKTIEPIYLYPKECQIRKAD